MGTPIIRKPNCNCNLLQFIINEQKNINQLHQYQILNPKKELLSSKTTRVFIQWKWFLTDNNEKKLRLVTYSITIDDNDDYNFKAHYDKIINSKKDIINCINNLS